MSEVEVAASNAASSEAIATPVETPVEQAAPVDTPDKPAKSAREAVERAFAKMGEADKPAPVEPKPVEPKPAERTDGRNDDGTFKAKADAKVDPVANVTEKPAVEIAPVVAQKVNPAPSGFTKASQEAWAQTPEPVRADVERRVSELTAGIEKYKTVAEPVLKFHDMAVQTGTTLDKALEAYVGLETVLRSDPVRGIFEVCRNIGIDPAQMAQAMAQRLQGQPQQQFQPRGDAPEVAQLKSEIAELKGKFEKMGQTFTQRETQQIVERFATDPAHPYFDDLADSISHMLETQFAKDLNDAYEKAVRLNPDVASKIDADKAAKAVPPKQPDSAQTREKAAKSITGTPSSGSNPQTRKPAGSPRDALQSAFAQLGLTG